MKIKKIFCAALLACCSLPLSAQNVQICLNQLGYTPEQEKTAIVISPKAQKFIVKDETGKIVLSGKTKVSAQSPFSEKKGWRIDLSQISAPGTYIINVGKETATFSVSETPLKAVGAAGMKAFYYQRTGMALDKKHAGKWSRPAAHLDNKVLVHPSAATQKRPAGTVISSPKGWYDAGDYNKYIVNSGYTIGQMLTIYPVCQKYYEGMALNIPKSGNGAPDFLNEIYYNLAWMLTMQDPYDGGVYHKLTTPNFEGFVKPTECKQPRYVVQKSTTAALDFAACMALAARIYAPYEKQFPGFSLTALNAAARAFAWAEKNPAVFYRQFEINKNHKPAVNTGEYGDGSAKDELFWAAVELWLTTGEKEYQAYVITNMPQQFSVPSWGNVGSLGLISLLLQKEDGAFAEQAKKLLLPWCDEYIKDVEQTMYLSPFGNKVSDFHWASIAEGVCTEGELLCLAYNATGDKKYLTNAHRNVDYMFGKNPLGICYVTGFGEKSPMNPHHRPSFSDGIEEPIPGLLVGGPNANPTDGVTYASKLPDESYADDHNSYTTNEIAINWNAGLVAITALLQSLK